VVVSGLLSIRIDQVYTGTLRPLPPEGRPTGIFKEPVAGRVLARREGLAGDAQADRRVHGGPEKALHQYAAENYALLAAAFPDCADRLVPGSLGENVSGRGLTEAEARIGDVFRLGTATIQVCQPRSPCWKIDHKFGTTTMARHIAELGIAGWYYRVLEEGEIGAGDLLELVERQEDAPSLRRLWQANLDLQARPEELEALARAPGLAAGWVKKLAERADWLRRHRPGAGA
jgi:MOSC domain-containing protein YiiM